MNLFYQECNLLGTANSSLTKNPQPKKTFSGPFAEIAATDLFSALFLWVSQQKLWNNPGAKSG